MTANRPRSDRPDDQRNRSVVLEAFVRGIVVETLGSGAAVAQVQTLQANDTHAALLVTLVDEARLVVKVAEGRPTPAMDFRRTAAVSALARNAGVPVASVLIADTSLRSGPWQYLIQQYVDGTEWRELHPSLSDEQRDVVHRQIAEAVLAMQTVRFDSFGELDAAGQPQPSDQLNALRRRAALRIAYESKRAVFLELVDRERAVLSAAASPTLVHDDLHHGNLVFQEHGEGWALAGVLDWDKAWAGPAESDVARLAFWDGMTGPGFWDVYRADHPASADAEFRSLIYQLLWCLEYDEATPRHLADTAAICSRLGVVLPT